MSGSLGLVPPVDTVTEEEKRRKAQALALAAGRAGGIVSNAVIGPASGSIGGY